REAALRDFGGNDKSEEAVANGLKWIANQQSGDGRWNLDKTATEHSIGATALALLPFLADGKTHKPAKDNPYDKTIAKGLNYLKKSQATKTGFSGANLSDPPPPTIAVSEAYGMTNDPALKLTAQKAVSLIVNIQGNDGSWDYGPAKSTRTDLSVSGWQLIAL